MLISILTNKAKRRGEGFQEIPKTQMKVYHHKIIIKKGLKFYRLSVSIQEKDLENVMEIVEKEDLEKGESICRLATKLVNLF